MAPTRVVARDAAIAGIAAAVVTTLLAPRDLWLSLHPHPAWAVVLLLAVAHGSHGLALAVPATWGALMLSALATGLGAGPVMAALSHPADIGALGAGVLVAWVASVHGRREVDLSDRVLLLEKRKADGREVVGQLRGATAALGARADRMGGSLAVVCDVAERLEGDDPIAGARAALDFALARTGAHAGAVYLVDDGPLRALAERGLGDAAAQHLSCDRTVRAALETARSVRAIDLPEAKGEGSDIATPIMNDAGEVLGVLALCKVPADSLRPVMVLDIEFIARWCAGPLRAAGASRAGTAAVPNPAAVLALN